MTIHTLFRLEWSLRAATLVGMTGAGGIGQALYVADPLLCKPMMADGFSTWAIVTLADAQSDCTCAPLGWAAMIT